MSKGSGSGIVSTADSSQETLIFGDLNHVGPTSAINMLAICVQSTNKTNLGEAKEEGFWNIPNPVDHHLTFPPQALRAVLLGRLNGLHSRVA